MSNVTSSTKVATILPLAAWFGLLSGLVESVIYLAGQTSGRITNVWYPILWISPLVNLLLFVASGTILILAARLLPRFPIRMIAVFGFAFLTFFDWIAIFTYENIHPLAIVLLAAGLAFQVTRVFQRRPEGLLGFWHRSLPALALITGLAFIVLQGGGWVRDRITESRLSSAASDRPDILFIVVDALRADRLSSYGNERQTSPNIDRLAQEGVLFENAFATSSYSLPSHVSLMTGLYTFEHGAEWYNPTALRQSNYPTLAGQLSAQGYRTGGFSANTFWVTREQGFGRGFLHYEDYFHSPSDAALRTFYGRAFEKFVLPRMGYEDIPARRRVKSINRSVLNWLQTDQERPYFVFINYMDVHDPYLPPQPYRSQYSDDPSPGGLLNWRMGREDIPITPAEMQGELDAYDGAISYVDHHLGLLLEELHRMGRSDNLLVIITSDHGDSFGEHGMFLHANSLYREVIQVPLILWFPAHVPAGVRVEQPVSNASLPATIWRLTGAGDSPFHDPDLTALWEQPGLHAGWPSPLAEMAQQDWQPERYPVHAGWLKTLLDPQWHYIEHETQGVELYAWQEDLQGINNLAGRPDMQPTLGDFHSRLRELLEGVRKIGMGAR